MIFLLEGPRLPLLNRAQVDLKPISADLTDTVRK